MRKSAGGGPGQILFPACCALRARARSVPINVVQTHLHGLDGYAGECLRANDERPTRALVGAETSRRLGGVIIANGLRWSSEA